MEHRAFGGPLGTEVRQASDAETLVTAPAGWYDDPTSGFLRYWDGNLWTDQTRPRSYVPAWRPYGSVEVQTSGARKSPSLLLSIAAGVLTVCLPFVILFRAGIAISVIFFLAALLVGYLAARQRDVDFALTIGQNERHSVRYRRSNWSGRMRVDVDGHPVLKKWVLLGFPLRRNDYVEVGTTERHDVYIVKTRPLFLPWLRPQPVGVYVDGSLVATYSLAGLQLSSG